MASGFLSRALPLTPGSSAELLVTAVASAGLLPAVAAAGIGCPTSLTQKSEGKQIRGREVAALQRCSPAVRPNISPLPLDPAVLLRGSVCPGSLALRPPRVWRCVWLRDLVEFISVNSGVKDFLVRVYTEPSGTLKNCRFQWLPISRDRDELARPARSPPFAFAEGGRAAQSEPRAGQMVLAGPDPAVFRWIQAQPSET